ncbi:hypothetical protein ACHAWC_005446, partial [Mediolabrus comicus]
MIRREALIIVLAAALLLLSTAQAQRPTVSPSPGQQQNFEPTVMPTYFPTQGPTNSSSPTTLLIGGGTYDNTSLSPSQSPSVVMNSSSSASPS